MSGDMGSTRWDSAVFFVIGLFLGALTGWLITTTALGYLALIVVVALIVGPWLDIYFISDIATKLLELVWAGVSRLGHAIYRGGASAKEPPAIAAPAFGLGYLISVVAVIWMSASGAGGNA
ncbi:hypothetical protein [Paracoccus pacificus]|uniref:Uncharacterized protein n=1 Tax=Paracoccus pacificus TaxID=1463598 RepID=A0ABW4RB02_9RHOB